MLVVIIPKNFLVNSFCVKIFFNFVTPGNSLDILCFFHVYLHKLKYIVKNSGNRIQMFQNNSMIGRVSYNVHESILNIQNVNKMHACFKYYFLQEFYIEQSNRKKYKNVEV